QVTPPGSPCSVHFGTHITSSPPGSAQQLWLIVSDIQAARRARGGSRGGDGAEVSHLPGWNRLAPKGRRSGPAPNRQTYASFVSFSDPDGNGWLLQEITTRLPGRVAGATTYAPGGDAAARARARRQRGRVGGRPGAGAQARGGRPRQARGADGAAGRGLAQLVRR